MQEGSSGRSSQSRHDGEKGERHGGDGRSKGGERMSQCRHLGLGMGKEWTQNVPVQAAGIGDGEGRDPSVLRSKLLIKHFAQLCPFPFEKSLRSRYSQTQPHSLGRVLVLQPD